MQQFKITLGCILLALFVGGTVPAKADLVPDNVEFALLKKFYDSLGGNAWTKKTNWPTAGNWPAAATSAQFGTWYGVTVVNGDITQIILSNNKLFGKMPTNMGDLTALKVLDLNTNAISGRIQASVTQLTNLTTLRLDQNRLTGSIPYDIGKLNKLTQLYLLDNQLSGALPSSLGSLASMTDLQLQINSFTGTIPSSLGNLAGLSTLRLDQNQLSGTIPTSLSYLSNLVALYLSYNQLTGSIPQSLGNLTNLTGLYLHVNQLTGTIPGELGNLTKLQSLYLSNNQLTGTLPKELARITSMANLLLSSNKLSGPIPTEYSAMNNLVYLYLSGNNLGGALPPSLGQLTKLRYFYVYDNQLTGPVPVEYSALTEILSFYAYNNQLSGTLPSGLFGNWSKLQLLDMHSNKLSGVFPATISSCPLLTSIILYGNRFSSLPSALLNMPVLATADFSDNEITFAPAFGTHVNKTKLTLNLSNNRLDFSILEPMQGMGIKTLIVSPQKNINDITSVKAMQDAGLVIPARDPAAHGTTTWEKRQSDGSWSSVDSNNEDLTGRTFIRNGFTSSDEGVYRWTTKNSILTAMTIQSDPIVVNRGLSFVLDNWAFQYRYDTKSRRVAAKMPGADWVYTVYDDRDRVVMTQDGEQRKVKKWSYTIYDALNRPVISGIYTHSDYVDRDSMSAMVARADFYETYTGDKANHGYSNTVFEAPDFVPANFAPQTITYYDNYNFRSGWGSEYAYTPGQVDAVTIDGVEYSQPATENLGVSGQITGMKVKTLEDQPQWLYTINYYDDRYRLVQSKADNIKGGIDFVTNLYDFTGKVLASKSTHATGKVTWQNMVAVIVDGDNLVKTGSSASWGTSGASSVEKIPANTSGWVEAAVGELATRRMFGLSPQDRDQNSTSIKYGLYLNMGTLSIQITLPNGALQTISTTYPLVPGDRLRIAREDGYINFYKNGIKLYPTTATQMLPSTEALLVDVALGTPLATISKLRVSAGQQAVSAISRRFEYDHAGRLMKTWHKLNNAGEVLLAQNEYNELGQLVGKNLHSTEPTGTADEQRHFKQGIDYRYDIRGWLTSINNSTLTNVAAINPDHANTPKDLFGMELGYHLSLGTGNIAMYNGNISGIKWSNSLGLGDVKENAYNYTYDPMKRITQADFREKKSAWDLPAYTDTNGNTQTAASYSETGYKYDQNGNILEMRRKAAKGEDMDVLNYFYGDNQNRSNKLLAVTDTGNKITGFNDGNAVGNDYSYDANGSMIGDLNKDVTSIVYNDLRLPAKVVKRNGDYLTYTYDAAGRKLRQLVFNSSSVQQKRSDYVGEYFYENDTLRFINHEDGRVVTTGAAPEYQYFLKDHLGNVRMTFTTKSDIDAALATLETATADEESAKFLNYEEAVKLNSLVFDHTHTLEGHAGDTTHYSVLLRGESGTTSEKYGLAKSLSVMPGDTVKMEVFAKYLDIQGTSISAEVNNVVAILANGVRNTGPFIDGGAAGSLGGTLFPFAALLTPPKNSDGEAPKAYLNWLVFDRDFTMKDAGNQRVSILAAETGSGTVSHERLARDLVITEAGYVYIYLSNEGTDPVDVFFDDFAVEHVKGPVVQMEDYYPFGLTFNSHRRENGLKNQYLYNGKERIDALGLNLYDYGARMYMPDLARWGVVDPMAEKGRRWNPYNYALDNPMRFIDPDGMFSTDVVKNNNGTYRVVDAKADGDTRIYVRDAENNRTGEVIGNTVSDRSFIAERGRVVRGAIINLGDQSGVDFLNSKIIGDDNLSIGEYMANATRGKRYDFKRQDIEGNIAPGQTELQYMYRAMPIDGITGLKRSENELPTIATARDIGNVAAGFVAGDNGLNWQQARLGFDLLQSYQRRTIEVEIPTTQFAERLGHNLGLEHYAKKHPINNFLSSPSHPFPPH